MHEKLYVLMVPAGCCTHTTDPSLFMMARRYVTPVIVDPELLLQTISKRNNDGPPNIPPEYFNEVIK